MRRHLLSLGLAALFFNPSFAQATEAVRDDSVETSNFGKPRAAEPAGPLTLKAAIQLAFDANPEISALIEDTRTPTRTTTLQVNQPIELGGKCAARIAAAERGRDAASAELDAKRAEIRATVVATFLDALAAQERLCLAEVSVELARCAAAPGALIRTHPTSSNTAVRTSCTARKEFL